MTSGESASGSKDEYEVEAIIKDRLRSAFDEETGKYKNVKEYLIKWVGYKTKSWEPAQNLEGCQELLQNYINNKRKKMQKNTKTPYRFRKKNANNGIKGIEKQKRSYYLSDDNEDDLGDNNKNNKSNIKSNIKTRLREEKKATNGFENDFDIDVVNEEIESPFKKKENDYNDKTKNAKNLNLMNKKRRRKDSNISISIDDSHVKTDSNSKLNQNEIANLNQEINKNNSDNNEKFIGITQVIIPKNKNEPICIYYDILKNNKIICVEGYSQNSKLISKDEIITCYESILKHYLGGKRLKFNNLRDK